MKLHHEQEKYFVDLYNRGVYYIFSTFRPDYYQQVKAMEQKAMTDKNTKYLIFPFLCAVFKIEEVSTDQQMHERRLKKYKK